MFEDISLARKEGRYCDCDTLTSPLGPLGLVVFLLVALFVRFKSIFMPCRSVGGVSKTLPMKTL